MPDESELRKVLRSADIATGDTGEIDVAAVLRRSRARRRPRVIAAAAGGVLAVAAIVVPVTVSSLGSGSTSSVSADEAAPDQAAPESATGGAAGDTSELMQGDADGVAPAEKLNLCTAPLAEVAPAASGLVLTVEPVAASATDSGIPVTVTLTNTGAQRVTGTTAASPALTLSSGGTTVWHSNGPTIMMVTVVDLAPGASMRYSATFEPLLCGVDDDLAESFRPDLPAAGPGTYGLSAAIELLTDDGARELVTGPIAVVTLG